MIKDHEIFDHHCHWTILNILTWTGIIYLEISIFFCMCLFLIHRRKKIQNDDSCVNRSNIDVMIVSVFVLQYVNHRMKSTLSLSLYGKWRNIQLWMRKKIFKTKIDLSKSLNSHCIKQKKKVETLIGKFKRKTKTITNYGIFNFGKKGRYIYINAK